MNTTAEELDQITDNLSKAAYQITIEQVGDVFHSPSVGYVLVGSEILYSPIHEGALKQHSPEVYITWMKM